MLECVSERLDIINFVYISTIEAAWDLKWGFENLMRKTMAPSLIGGDCCWFEIFHRKLGKSLRMSIKTSGSFEIVGQVSLVSCTRWQVRTSEFYLTGNQTLGGGRKLSLCQTDQRTSHFCRDQS